MPGRQSTGPLSLLKSSKPKISKRKKQRSLNALAIAEKTNPELTKIRRHRLGEVDFDGNLKRKRALTQRDDSESEGEELEDESALGTKRRRGERAKHDGNVERGSDSEGNEWMLGGVESEDDESLDSDEAMGEGDDEKFEGFAFRGSSSQGKKREVSMRKKEEFEDEEGVGEINLDEGEGEEEEEEEEEDAFGEDGVDLAAVLDEESDKEPSGSEVDAPEQGSEDKASDLSISENEDGIEESVKLVSLQSMVNALNEQDQSQTLKRKMPEAHESTTPSQFGLTSKQKLTVADLLPSVTHPQLRKSLRILEENESKSSKRGIAKKLGVPLAKRQQDRLDRAAAYDKSKETLNRWIDTVKHNRRAEHLSFPLHNPDAVAARGGNKIERSLKPLTDLENAVQTILHENGLAPSDGKSEQERILEAEELETNKLPLAEVQARRVELRRARELLFREEVRAKRIKKIKSKSYRRVHRKERERLEQKDKEALAAAGAGDSESEKEKNDRRRAEERMGAKHRESRWAKGVKDTGRMAWDEDARGGVEEMARREEELKKRMLGKEVGESDEDDTDDTDIGEDGEEMSRRTLKDRLQSLEDRQQDLQAKTKSSTSALSSMKFMRNAESAQKVSNDQIIEQMRREFAGEDSLSEEEPDEGPGRRSYGPSKNKAALLGYTPEVQSGEFEELQQSDKENEDNAQDPEGHDLEIIVDTVETARPFSNKKSLIAGRGLGENSKRRAEPIDQTIHENPWLSGGKPKSSKRDRNLANSRAGVIISNQLSEAATTIAKESPSRSEWHPVKAAEKHQSKAGLGTTRPVAEGNSDGEEGDESPNLPFVLRNKDLVRKAFTGDDVVADFEKEKQDTIKSEDEKIIDNTLPGWGSWTGAGLSKKAERRNKGRFLSKQAGIPKQKRQDAKLDKVIINEKRVKKNAKYLASNLPHPFETRQQYERSLRLPVGPEWTTKETFQAATKPKILLKQGIITPMVKPIV